MLSGSFGDTIGSVAQAFLPPSIGTPSQAWRIAKALFLCGLVIAVINSAFGAAILSFAMPLFTSSSAVLEQIASVAPLFILALSLHCCSMSTEGILLAGRESAFLCFSYIGIYFALTVRPLTARPVSGWCFLLSYIPLMSASCDACVQSAPGCLANTASTWHMMTASQEILCCIV